MIHVNNISKSFNDLKVIDNISFTVSEGEIVSIIGESGCGKTTMLKCLVGLVSPDNGNISIPDCISYVPQNLGLLPWRTVRENINLPMEFLKKDGNTDDIINLMGLKGFENYYVRQLSGGMSQRTAIGRALVIKPKILLLDEPFKSLDEITRSRLNNELRELWRKMGTTVILVTHSIKEAVHLSDRIIILSNRPSKVKEEVHCQRNCEEVYLYNLEIKVRNILFRD